MKATENFGSRSAWRTASRPAFWTLALSVAFAAPATLVAQTASPAPLIDRELFFGNPEISGAQISRSEEHTSELQSPCNLVCRLLLEKKKKIQQQLAQ